VVEEDVGLSGVHPGDGGVGDVGVTSDVGDGAEERLVSSTLWVHVLVEEAVRVGGTGLLETEVIGTLRKTEHVSGVDGEVHTDGVTLLEGGVSVVGGGSLVVSGSDSLVVDGSSLVMDGSSLVVDGGSLVVGGSDSLVVDGSSLVVNSGSLLHAVVEQVVVVVDNDGLVTVNVLDDSEGIELDLVGDSVLAGDQDAVVEDLDEVLKVLLDLDLIPVDTDASVGDREALVLVAGLNLDLHDAFLEQGKVEVQVRVAGLNLVGVVVVVVQSESAVDRILVDDKAVGLDEVGSGDLVLAVVMVIILNNPVVLVVGEELGEAVAVVLLGASVLVDLGELVVAVALIGVLVLVPVVRGVVHGLVIVMVVVGVGLAVLIVMVTVLVLVAVALGVDGVLTLEVVLAVVDGDLVVSFEDGLEGHLVGGEGLASGLGLKTEEASGNNFGGGVHFDER